MSTGMPSLSVAVVVASIAVVPNVASATPLANPLAIKNAAGADIEMVWGRGFGWGLGAGFLGGAIIGGALAAPYYYRPYYYYGPPYYPPAAYGPGYYPAPAYRAPPAYGPGYYPPAFYGNPDRTFGRHCSGGSC